MDFYIPGLHFLLLKKDFGTWLVGQTGLWFAKMDFAEWVWVELL